MGAWGQGGLTATSCPRHSVPQGVQGGKMDQRRRYGHCATLSNFIEPQAAKASGSVCACGGGGGRQSGRGAKAGQAGYLLLAQGTLLQVNARLRCTPSHGCTDRRVVREGRWANAPAMLSAPSAPMALYPRLQQSEVQTRASSSSQHGVLLHDRTHATLTSHLWRRSSGCTTQQTGRGSRAAAIGSVL